MFMFAVHTLRFFMLIFFLTHVCCCRCAAPPFCFECPSWSYCFPDIQFAQFSRYQSPRKTSAHYNFWRPQQTMWLRTHFPFLSRFFFAVFFVVDGGLFTFKRISNIYVTTTRFQFHFKLQKSHVCLKFRSQGLERFTYWPGPPRTHFLFFQFWFYLCNFLLIFLSTAVSHHVKGYQTLMQQQLDFNLMSSHKFPPLF